MRIKFSNQQKIDDPWWFSFSRTIVPHPLHLVKTVVAKGSKLPI